MDYSLIGLIVSIVVQLLTAGILIGGLAVSIKYIEKQIGQNKTDITKSIDDHKQAIKDTFDDYKQDVKEHIDRLEQKQDKHNGLIERMVVVEQSNKSAHHRIDELKDKGS